MHRTTLAAVLGLVSALLTPNSATAQTVDTLGGVNTASTRTNSAKGSVYRCDQTVFVMDYEMYLNIPGPETLTFFVYRHHSRSGSYALEWTGSYQVAGGGGPAWYGTGPVGITLAEGNHYLLGVSWPGSLTYYYSTGATNTPTSFGSWQRANTLTNPLPANYSVAAGVDVAMYHQRLTTIPTAAVDIVGTGCGATPAPRLVAAAPLAVGATRNLEVVEAAANTLAVYAIALGATIPAPIPALGCNVWLTLGGAVANLIQVTSATGYAAVPFAVPADPAYAGLQLSVQAVVLGGSAAFTNALDLQVQ